MTGTWECALPRAEAIGLTGEDGPLSNGLPGVITRDGGKVTLDDSAFDSLRHLGHQHQPQGGAQIVLNAGPPCIVFDGETPCIVFGRDPRDRYPVFRVAEGTPAAR